MKVFLTGGTGVVGTRALPALVAAGHDVTAVARTDAKAALVDRLGGRSVHVDLFDQEAVAAAVVGHEAVVNLATSIPPMSQAARPSAWAGNERLRIEASAHLVDAALAAGAGRVIQESITYPYVDCGDRWIDEDVECTHVGAFAGAATAEAATSRFAHQGGSGVVLRFGAFYAPDSSHLQAFNKLARWRVNPFIGDPEGFASFIHAGDAGDAVVAALRAPSGTYNVVDDRPLSRTEAGEAVADALGVGRVHAVPKAVLALMPSAAKALDRSQRVSNRRFKEASGWSPAHPSISGAWPGRSGW